MPQYVELIDQAEDKVFAGVKQIQDAIVTATGTLSQTVAERLPEMPQIPFADQMPAPEWVVVKGFEMAERMFQSQRTFANHMLKAITPVTTKLEGKVVARAPRRAARTTSKAS
jgi:hypothetical protein